MQSASYLMGFEGPEHASPPIGFRIILSINIQKCKTLLLQIYLLNKLHILNKIILLQNLTKSRIGSKYVRKAGKNNS